MWASARVVCVAVVLALVATPTLANINGAVASAGIDGDVEAEAKRQLRQECSSLPSLQGAPWIGELVRSVYPSASDALEGVRMQQSLTSHIRNTTRRLAMTDEQTLIALSTSSSPLPGALFALLFLAPVSDFQMTKVCTLAVPLLFIVTVAVSGMVVQRNWWFFDDLRGVDVFAMSETRVAVRDSQIDNFAALACLLSMVHAVVLLLCYEPSGGTKCALRRQQFSFFTFPSLLLLLVGMMRSRATELLRYKEPRPQPSPQPNIDADTLPTTEHMFKGVNVGAEIAQPERSRVEPEAKVQVKRLERHGASQVLNDFLSYFRHSSLPMAAGMLLGVLLLHSALVCAN